MTLPALSAPSGVRRLRTTPYARRLARERGLALDNVIGTGPDGRITGADVIGFRTAEATAAPAPLPASAGDAAPLLPAVLPPAVPASALSVPLRFGPVQELLAQVAAAGASVSHEDIVLKAAAAACADVLAEGEPVLLLQRGRETVRMAGLRHASLSGVAAQREAGRTGEGAATLAVSFLSRAGVRPVAARLAEGTPARLVVGFPDGDNGTECLLAYDPDRIADEAAADFLAVLKQGIETPLRLLV